MGLFNQWRRKHLGNPEEQTNETPPEAPGTREYFDSLSACIGPARLRQHAFGRLVVRDQDWNVDFSRGVIRFGEDTYPVQFLGTESEVSHTWLWAHVNPGDFPEAVLKRGIRFYEQCVAEGMEELRQEELPLTPLVNGHNIASMAASTTEGGACYYRCPYENGAAFVLVTGLPDDVFAPAPVQEVVSAAADLIRQFPLNHGILMSNLLADNCVEVVEENGVLTGRFADGTTLTVRFDEMGRITSLKPEGGNA